MSEASIELHGVNKSFRTTHAVRDLDLAVPRGSVCGFLGPNGAGKTTTIRMIMSIIYPDTGSISVLGGSAPWVEAWRVSPSKIKEVSNSSLIFGSLS